MYYDDFIAHQVTRANNPSATHLVVDPRRSERRLLRTLWSLVRQVAWGIDALTRVQHGIDVPPDHGARRQPRPAISRTSRRTGPR